MKRLLFVLLFLPLFLKAQFITTIAGDGRSYYNGDGIAATSAELNLPWGICTDVHGNIFIADLINNRIRKVDTSGIIWTIAGDGTLAYTGDKGLAINAEVSEPSNITTDKIGNIYFVDGNGIRKIDTSGIITRFAGTGVAGYSGDGGHASFAQFNGIGKLIFDVAGNLLVIDAYNFCVRKIDTAAIITTIVGCGIRGFGGDGGPAVLARLDRPHGLNIDNLGNIYIADSYNNRVRKVNTSGIISTIAGTDSAGFSGDGGAAVSAKLYVPNDIAFDAFGNIFISDCYNNRIRKINSLGIISTIAGNGLPGYNGDGIATSSKLSNPGSIMTDNKGNLVIADQDNNRIRKITNTFIAKDTILSPIGGKDSLCIGNTTNLSDSSNGGVWSSSNPGVAAISTEGVVSGFALGVVTISYSIANYYTTFTITIDSCELHRYISNPVSNTFPNPCHGSFIFSMATNQEEDATILITNRMGEIVKEVNTKTNTDTEITLDFPSGLYFISVMTSQGRQITKVMLL
jgi:hypothetical protein